MFLVLILHWNLVNDSAIPSRRRHSSSQQEYKLHSSSNSSSSFGITSFQLFFVVKLLILLSSSKIINWDQSLSTNSYCCEKILCPFCMSVKTLLGLDQESCAILKHWIWNLLLNMVLNVVLCKLIFTTLFAENFLTLDLYNK